MKRCSLLLLLAACAVGAAPASMAQCPPNSWTNQGVLIPITLSCGICVAEINYLVCATAIPPIYQMSTVRRSSGACSCWDTKTAAEVYNAARAAMLQYYCNQFCTKDKEGIQLDVIIRQPACTHAANPAGQPSADWWTPCGSNQCEYHWAYTCSHAGVVGEGGRDAVCEEWHLQSKNLPAVTCPATGVDPTCQAACN